MILRMHSGYKNDRWHPVGNKIPFAGGYSVSGASKSVDVLILSK